jgi:hypothetical protein
VAYSLWDSHELKSETEAPRTVTSRDTRLARRALTRRALIGRRWHSDRALSFCPLARASTSHCRRVWLRLRTEPRLRPLHAGGGTLRVSKPGDILPAGAPYVLTGANRDLFTLLYDTLVSYDQQLTPRLRLATSWEWSPDARRLTVHLRASRSTLGGHSPVPTRNSTSSTCATRRSAHNGAVIPTRCTSPRRIMPQS